MGVVGKLNDNVCFIVLVRFYLLNDFGLYNMVGNVNEWVQDFYCFLISVILCDVENYDLNLYCGGKFCQKVLDEDGCLVEKDSLG